MTNDKKKKVYSNLATGAGTSVVSSGPMIQREPMSPAEQAFRGPVAKPARVVMAENAAGNSNPVSPRGDVANKRMSQMRNIFSLKKPEMISFKTNPNMDWRQAASLNKSAVDGYNQTRSAAVSAMGGVANQDVSGQASMDATKQRGQNVLANTMATDANAQKNTRLNAELNAQAAETQDSRTVKAAERQNSWDKAKANREAGFRLMEQGVPGSQAQQIMSAGEFDADVTNTTVPSDPVKPQRQHFAPHQYDNNGELRPGTGQYYQAPGEDGGATQPAPQAAIQNLIDDPASADAFFEKYGYLPEGF